MLRRHFPIVVLGLLFADLASLIWLGGFVGVLLVLALVILDILVGSALIRRSGTNIFTMMNTPASDKKAVSGGAAQSLLGAIAGLLFIIPGDRERFHCFDPSAAMGPPAHGQVF